jgi:hypothetical protein
VQAPTAWRTSIEKKELKEEKRDTWREKYVLFDLEFDVEKNKRPR